MTWWIVLLPLNVVVMGLILHRQDTLPNAVYTRDDVYVNIKGSVHWEKNFVKSHV